MRDVLPGSLAAASAVLGLAAARGAVPGWPLPPAAGLLLALPLVALLALHVRAARARRLRRYGLGW